MGEKDQKNQGKKQNLEGGGHKQDGGGPTPTTESQTSTAQRDNSRRDPKSR
jgi:hypothetical protein